MLQSGLMRPVLHAEMLPSFSRQSDAQFLMFSCFPSHFPSPQRSQHSPLMPRSGSLGAIIDSPLQHFGGSRTLGIDSPLFLHVTQSSGQLNADSFFASHLPSPHLFVQMPLADPLEKMRGLMSFNPAQHCGVPGMLTDDSPSFLHGAQSLGQLIQTLSPCRIRCFPHFAEHIPLHADKRELLGF